MGATGLKANGVVPVPIKNACLPPPKSSGNFAANLAPARRRSATLPDGRNRELIGGIGRERLGHRSALLLFARQKNPEWPLDRAGARAREALAAVRPGLRPLEVGVPPHECAAVLRLILTIARLP